MKEENKKRNKWLHVQLTESEYRQIHEQFAKTIDLKVVILFAKKNLGKPIIGSYRDASMDAFMEELIGLKSGLSAIGNNFNQAVKRLHTLIKIKEFDHRLVSYELDRRKLSKQLDEAQISSKKWPTNGYSDPSEEQSEGSRQNYNERKVQRQVATLLDPHQYPKDPADLTFKQRLARLENRAK